MRNYNIAIDGPAGAGKSTIAKSIAQKLQYIYVDTGAMYRAMALYMIRNGIDTSEEAAVSKACSLINITIEYIGGEQQVKLNGENVTAFIRDEEIGKNASMVARYHAVRKKMVELQRNLASSSDVIMDGRDIGTVVLPKADLKIYLTASSKTRALRRWKELDDKGISSNMEDVEADIIKRDRQDMNREVSPLRQAEDAVLVDSSDLTIEEVIDKIILLFKEKYDGDSL